MAFGEYSSRDGSPKAKSQHFKELAFLGNYARMCPRLEIKWNYDCRFAWRNELAVDNAVTKLVHTGWLVAFMVGFRQCASPADR
jgi:hypothetical protein